MRRKDKMTTEKGALSIVDECAYMSMASVNPDGTPYNVPVCMAREGNKLYFHCAREGKKLDNIRANPAVCVTCVTNAKPIPNTFSFNYASAVVTGRAYEVTDENERYEALMLISKRYAPGMMDKFEAEMQRSAKAASIVRIDIDEITGKRDDRG